MRLVDCPKCEGSGEYHPPLLPPDYTIVCDLCGGTGAVLPQQLEPRG